MRNPPNYGSIVNLGKNRRRPLGVRVPNGYKLRDDFTEIIQYKYIGYFENTPQGKRDARLLLAQYNAGINVTVEVNSTPTFEDCATAFVERHLEILEHKKGKYSRNTEVALYGIIKNQCKDICQCKINTLRVYDIQTIADNCKDMSISSIGNLKVVLNGTFDYARKNGYISENFIKDIDFLYKKKSSEKHKVFTDAEIQRLWDNADDKGVKTVLMLIYTGMRINEFLSLPKNKIFLDSQYLVCGTKTEAGSNRKVPIADKVLPFFKEFYNNDSDYLLPGKSTHLTRNAYMTSYWDKVIKGLCMKHLPHDTRYTCATLLDKADVKDNIIKFILGHQQTDITNQVYIHPDVETLLKNINKI
jgi:integrase